MGDPLQMYLADVLTVGAQPGRRPRAVAALRLHQGGPADRPADHRPGAGRGDLLPRRRRLRGAHEWHERLPPGGGVVSLRRATRSSSGSRCTCSSRRSRRSSPGRRRRSAPSRTRTTDPVCLGMPGTLPVLNRAAVDAAVRLGLAVGCKIRPRCRFARKHYFYPGPAQGLSDLAVRRADLRGRRHQVPPARRGARGAPDPHPHGRGRGQEPARRRRASASSTTTAPAFRCARSSASPTCARPRRRPSTCARIRTLVRYLGIGDGNMEEGSLRCDANVSLRPRGATKYGTKTEIKNMNSFKNVRDAIEHEVKRQAALLDRRRARRPGDAPVGRGARRDAGDALEGAGARLPLFPRARSAAAGGRPTPRWPRCAPACPSCPRIASPATPATVGLSPQDAGVLVAEREIADYFDADGRRRRARPSAPPTGSSTRCSRASTIRARSATPTCPVPPAALAELVKLVEDGTLSGKLGKDVFAQACGPSGARAARHRRGRGAGPGLRQRRAGGGLQARHRRPPRRGRPASRPTPS